MLNKQIFIIMICFIWNGELFAKCRLKYDSELVARSKVIFLGKIKSANIDPNLKGIYKVCGDKKLNELQLKYEVEPMTFLKGKIYSDKPLVLDYNFTCKRMPPHIYFDPKKEYLFAVESVESNKLNLVGYSCGFWGWDSSELKSIYSLIPQDQLTDARMCLDSTSLEECVDCCTDRSWPVAYARSVDCREKTAKGSTMMVSKEDLQSFNDKTQGFICPSYKVSKDFISKGTTSCRKKCVEKFKENSR